MIIEKSDEGIIIKLGDFGYVYFEPLGKTNDNNKFSMILKINHVMTIGDKSLYVVKDKDELIKNSIIVSLNNLHEVIDNIIKEIEKGDLNGKR